MLFTRDLRLHDHPGLSEACRTGEVVPAFVWDPDLAAASPNRARFLAESLVDLEQALRQRGSRLLLRRGPVAEGAAQLAAEARCDRIFLTADAGTYPTARLERLNRLAAARGIGVEPFPGHAVVEPGTIAPAARSSYRVFTPYWRAWRAVEWRRPLPAPPSIPTPPDLDPGARPDPSRNLPTASDLPPGGSHAGRRSLSRFLRDELGNGRLRNDLAADATSRLSPYLRFGCVSATEVAHRVERAGGDQWFLRQLAWRDFYSQLRVELPELTRRDLRAPPDGPRVPDGELFAAWAEGRTGFPLVDAGMRQLLGEGWMHNRARMVTASFLVRRCGIPWQEGARHFLAHLVDGDPASNAGGWQWAAGTGTDPRRSRPLNPVRQAARFDPTGAYTRRYVPELAGLPTHLVHAPWLNPSRARSLRYPAPVIEVAGMGIREPIRSDPARTSSPRYVPGTPRREALEENAAPA
jgi:deoxyribodipyrimidine photo-lyase